MLRAARKKHHVALVVLHSAGISCPEAFVTRRSRVTDGARPRISSRAARCEIPSRAWLATQCAEPFDAIELDLAALW